MPPLSYFTYILKCSDGSYYVGSTDDLDRRIVEHNSGQGGHYTRSVAPVELLWHEAHPTRDSAVKRELQIKGWTRRKKEALIAGDLALLKRL